MERKLVIIKLGGSIITFKNEPLKANKIQIDKIAKSINKVRTPIIVVHGGGSFGHFYAKKYRFGLNPKKGSISGVSKIKMAMAELNLIIVKTFEKYDLKPYAIPPLYLFNGQQVMKTSIQNLLPLIDEGLTPITHGDILPWKNFFYIMSGDQIVRILAELLLPKKVIFVMDVDGIYESKNFKGKPIKELSVGETIKNMTTRIGIDVTGGIIRKLDEAEKIASLGIDTYFTNGFKPSRIEKLLKDETATCTLMRGVK